MTPASFLLALSLILASLLPCALAQNPWNDRPAMAPLPTWAIAVVVIMGIATCIIIGLAIWRCICVYRMFQTLEKNAENGTVPVPTMSLYMWGNPNGYGYGYGRRARKRVRMDQMMMLNQQQMNGQQMQMNDMQTANQNAMMMNQPATAV